MVEITCLRDILFLEGLIALIPVKIGFVFWNSAAEIKYLKMLFTSR